MADYFLVSKSFEASSELEVTHQFCWARQITKWRIEFRELLSVFDCRHWEDTCGLLVRYKAHYWYIIDSVEDFCAPFIWIKSWKQNKSPSKWEGGLCRWSNNMSAPKLYMVCGRIADQDQSPKESESHLRGEGGGGAGGYQVDMALFTGCIVNRILSTYLFLLVVI